jgi:hypothetical protein
VFDRPQGTHWRRLQTSAPRTLGGGAGARSSAAAHAAPAPASAIILEYADSDGDLVRIDDDGDLRLYLNSLAAARAAPGGGGDLEVKLAARLVPGGELEHALAGESGRRVALLSFGAAPAAVTGHVQAMQSPQAYAHALYAALRELDAAGCDVILVEAPPVGGDWDGVNDRLRRASFGSGA